MERLSQHGRVIKICTDAGFLTTVEVGQYFVTKDTEEFSQFTEPVTCREYILLRDGKSSDPKGWIRGNNKSGPVLEVTTSYLQGKYGVEIRIEAVNKDNSYLWVRFSHGLNKFFTDLIDKEYDDNEQETSETKSDEFALQTNVLAFASRSKAKAKPRRSTCDCSSTRTVAICERIWTDIEPATQSNLAHPVSKRLTTLLRHGQLPREEDGAIEFWRKKIIFRIILCILIIGLTKSGRAAWQQEEETRKYFSIVLILQEQFCTSELSKVIQDAIPLILHYRRMC